MQLKTIKKVLSMILIIITLLSNFQGIVSAALIGGTKGLTSHGECRRNIEFKFDTGWGDIICDYICYKEGKSVKPAYCISHGKDGVEEIGDYKVDITKMLDNPKLYTTIINGFPYKTASELGVENDYDAYMATKQAIYTVILNRNVRAVYRGKNAAGNKIVNAIETISSKGKKGTQKYSDAQVSIAKVGTLTESGNNYTQTFSVSASHQVSNYDILNTAGLPTSAYIADMNGNKKTSFNNTDNFKVVIPKSSMTKDINVAISINAKCKTYPVLYGKTKIANTQDYAITVDPYGDFRASTTLNASLNTGKVQVKKIDAETKEAIEGVEFQLLKNGTQIATAKTNSSGIATFSNLYQGSYVLREITTNKEYILNSENFDITVEYNKTTSKTITNIHKKGHLKINKTDKDTSEPISGVTFKLLDLSGNVVASGTTNTNGELLFENLRTGKYKLKEIATNSNYVLNSLVFDVNIEYNKTTTQNITNEYKKGHIKINKTDAETSEPIEGVTFELLDLKGNRVATAITDKNGVANFNNIRIGQYKLKELSTNVNYILNEANFDVEVEYQKTTTMNIENKHKKGDLKIYKVDKDNHKIPLGNVIFDLFSYEFNKVVGTYTTDVNRRNHYS